MFYQPSAINLDYFSNSLDFLTKLFKEERNDKIKNNNLIIKNGFFVYNDNPLILSNLSKLSISEYSIIFSFNIFNTNTAEDIVLFNFLNKDQKTIFKLFLDKTTKQLKLNIGKKDDYNTEININENQNYFLCICPKKEFIGGSIHFYIKSLADSNYNHHTINTSSPNLNHTNFIELGKFDGILGELLMINKAINEKDIFHLFNIKNDYADILCFNRYDFIQKINKEFKDDNEDIIFFRNLKYQFYLKIITNKINPFLKHKTYINLKPCGKLSYLNNNIQLQKFVFSNCEDNFIREKGIEYLIFQLNNIINFSINNDDLNFYLFKLLNFFYEIPTTNIDINNSKDSKLYIDMKYTTFILSLLANMNTKNRKLILNQNIYEILLKYYNYMKNYTNTSSMMRIFLSIILDNRIFNLNVKNFEKNIDLIFDYIKNFKDTQMIKKDIFCKFLFYDKILESKEFKHNKYFLILGYFLTNKEIFIKSDKDKKEKIQDNLKPDRKSLIKVFINYINKINNKMKLYQYLKFIFYNCDLMKENIRKESEFFGKLTVQMNIIDTTHCKYCKYNQILCFLLSDEIFINSCSTKEEDKVFQYKPSSFMEYPTYNFIKGIFVQFFKMENKLKLKFIKDSDNEINDEIIFFKNNVKDKDLCALVDYSNYIPRIDAIISYFDFLYKKHLKFPDNENFLQLLKKSMKLIMSFIENVTDLDKNTATGDSIVLTKENNKFINDLFNSKNICNFFIIYFHLFDEPDFDILTKCIKNTVTKVYNPFYFKFLSPIISLHTDITQNFIIKNEIIKIIITGLINSVINSKITEIIIQNSVILLIIIYLIIHDPNDNQYITEEVEKFIIAFLRYIFENNFCYSKLLFNLKISDKDSQKTTFKNLSQRNLSINLSQNLSFSSLMHKSKKKKKKKQNENLYKFLPEITLDIILNLNEGKKYKDIDCKNLLDNFITQKGKHSMFYFIDENSFGNNESNDDILQIFNDKKLFPKFCDETNVSNILYSIFFLIYFEDKKNNLLNSIDILTEDQKSYLKYLDSLSEITFKDCILLYQKNGKKIKKLKTTNYMDEYQFKINYSVMEIFSKSFKDKDFDYKKFEGILTELNKKTDISLAKQKIYFLENKVSIISDRSRSNKYSDPLNSSKLYHKKKTYRKSSYLPDLIGFKKLNNSQEKSYSQKKIHRTESENKNIFKTTDNLNSNIKKNLFKIYSSDNLKIERKSTFDLAQSDFGDFSEVGDCNLTRTESSMNYNNDNNNNKIAEIFSDNENSEDDNLGVGNNKINIKKHLEDVQNRIFKNYSIHVSKKVENNENISPKNIINCEQRISCPSQIKLNEIEENSEEENIDESYEYLIEKLKDVEIWPYYKSIFGKTKSKNLKILFNPKQLLFYRYFGFTFHDYIFKNIKFKQIKNVFNVEYKNVSLEMSIPEEAKYELNYPTKLKNFTCKDYYRPFLKPAFNFFDDEFLIKSHSFIKKDVLNKYIYPGEQLYKIKFEKIKLFEKNIENNVVCENISNKGSIFGKIDFNYNFFVFCDFSNDDPRQKDNLANEKKKFYIYSSENADRLINKNKYIIIYYNEIKEILLRKIYFNNIAYEIFTRDNKSYFFNFFMKNNIKKFSDKLKEFVDKLNDNNSKEEKSSIKIDFIDDPIFLFSKMEYKSKFIKGYLSNFQYLLLVNKYSARTFNDNSQYLIFPLLYMDINKTKMRDLSKAICLNKNEEDIDYDKYYSNYDLLGFHFNNHYATLGYILYYLLRLLPFTNMQIKFQSGHFDTPSRLFSSLDNLLRVLNVTDENRELCPEFFFSFETFWNLNYNNFGFLGVNNKQINHFNTDQNCGIVEFIVTSKKLLNNVDISPWINIIFGYLQKGDRESLNKFPLYSYEQYNNFDQEIEDLIKKGVPMNKIVKDIKNKAGLITLGLTPVQLFKGAHPSKEIFNNKKENESPQMTSGKKLNLKKKGNEKEVNVINKYLFEFMTKLFNKNYKLFLNNNNNKSKVIAYKKNKIKIFNLYTENEKHKQRTRVLFDKDNNSQFKIIKISPYKNLIIEIFNNFYCICRLEDKTIKLFSEKQQISVQWSCIVTAISLFKNLNSCFTQTYEFHQILIGDEDGYLSLIDLSMEYINKTKTYKIISLNNTRKSKIFYSYINSILYVDRLDVIISSCTEGMISINNSYTFDLINIIELGNNFTVLDFLVSDYDLLYVSFHNNNDNNWYLRCYTLNGVNVTEMESKKEIIDFYIYDSYLSVVFDDKEIQFYDGYNLKKIIKDVLDKTVDLDKTKINKVKKCIYCQKIDKAIFILENGISLHDLEFDHK